jgi:hypothetical protein
MCMAQKKKKLKNSLTTARGRQLSSSTGNER